MNGIAHLTKSASIQGEITFKAYLYFYILSNVMVHNSKLYSRYEVDNLYRSLRYDGEDIDNALEELEDEGLIINRRGRLQVGVVNDAPKLFAGGSNDCNEEFSQLKKLCDEYVDGLFSRSAKGIAYKTVSEIDKLSNKAVEKYTVRDYAFLFKYSAEVVLMEPYRDLLDKEFGQMKNISKLYDSVTMIKMIIHYCIHYEKWGKYPSIPTISACKDEIKASMTGVKRKVKRHDDSKGGF